MISTVPTWARPAVESFLSNQTLPGTARQDLPAGPASEWFATSADQFDGLRSRDNGPEDLDPAPNSLRFHLEGTNADSVVRFEGEKDHGTLVAEVVAEGSSEPDIIVFQRLSAGAQDTVWVTREGEAHGAHVEPGLGFLLSPA